MIFPPWVPNICGSSRKVPQQDFWWKPCLHFFWGGKKKWPWGNFWFTTHIIFIHFDTQFFPWCFQQRKTKKNKKQESSFHNSQLPWESTPPKIFQEYPTPLPTAMPRPIGKPWSKTSVHGTFHPVLRLPLKMTKIQLNQYPGKRALSGRRIDICTPRMFMPYGSKRFTKAPSLGQGPTGKRGNQMKIRRHSSVHVSHQQKNQLCAQVWKVAEAWIISDVGEGWTILKQKKEKLLKTNGMFIKTAKQTLQSSSCKASSNNCKVLHQKSDVFRHLVETPNQSWGHVFAYQKEWSQKERIEVKLGSGETCVHYLLH